MRTFDKLRPCNMCLNARFDDELTESNDFSSYMIGSATKGNCITFSSGGGKPPVIEFRIWNEYSSVFEIVGSFTPKFCPNCGREITEYSDDFEAFPPQQRKECRNRIRKFSVKRPDISYMALIAMSRFTDLVKSEEHFMRDQERDDFIKLIAMNSLKINQYSPTVADAVYFCDGFEKGFNEGKCFINPEL